MTKRKFDFIYNWGEFRDIKDFGVNKIIFFVKTFKSVSHISEETFLRQVSKQKQTIIKLANAINYQSEELSYLLSLIANRNETPAVEFDPKDADDDEVFFQLQYRYSIIF